MLQSNRIWLDDPILGLRKSHEYVITNGLEVRIDPIFATGSEGMPSTIEELSRNVAQRRVVASTKAQHSSGADSDGKVCHL
jgi:hypothetical protein